MGMASKDTKITNTFYLAAKYDKRSQVLPIAALLMLHGHKVVSKWLDGSHDGTEVHAELTFSRLDLDHIGQSDTLVLFNLPIKCSEASSGRHVEFGYALGLRKKLIVVGRGNCIFYQQAHEFYPDIQEFLDVYAPGGKV